jgi:NitT/TauT family transport system substrate-binding protein
MSRLLPRIILVLFAVAALVGAILATRETGGASESIGPGGTEAPTLDFCTNPAATTPQLPIWAAVQGDAAGETFRLRIDEWRQPAQLQTALLAGKGDLWLGHIDGFARARAHGAPIVLLAVTGWRKMSVVSFDPAIGKPEDLLGKELPYAPKGSPAVPLLRSLLGREADSVRFEPQAPKQLALLLAQRKVDVALLPEPLVSSVLLKVPDLKLAFALEDAYAVRNQGRARIPWAGIAVHERIAMQYPERLRVLLDRMGEAAASLQAAPDRAGDVLPEAFADAVASEVFEASLRRDVILVEPAAAVRDELAAYLRLAAPELFAEDGSWFDQGFLWSPPAAAPEP